MWERLKRLNIFARVRELEAREAERDKALELMLSQLEAVQVFLDERARKIGEQNTRLNAVIGYNLDILNDLDVK
jgi:putative sterol carrier protein